MEMNKANHCTIDPKRVNHDQIVTFSLDEPRYALNLQAVQRIIRAVEILPLPKAPDIVLGVIDVQGQIIPVIDVRRRFRLPPRETDVDDLFIIAITPTRTVALVVDSVIGVRELDEGDIVDADHIIPSLEYVRGIAQLDDGLVLIYDLDRFLSIDEELTLDIALSGGRN